MRLMADYLLDSDLCLPPDDPPMVIPGPDGRFTLTLSNASNEAKDSRGVLKARIVFEADALEGSRSIADEHLQQALNALSFVTGHPFTYHSIKQIVDWTPGISMREMHRFLESPMRDLAEPWLGEEFGPTVAHFLVTQAGSRQQTALRWFRIGLAADGVEDQFAYLWYALEITAEALKDREKVPSSCPHCKSPLYCEKCEKHPVHKKYPGQAIRDVVNRHADPDAAFDVFECLQKIRHALMHGDRIASVIGTLPCTTDEAVNALGHITQEALAEMFTAQNPNPPTKLLMARSSDLTRKNIVMTMHASVGMGGNPDDPQFDDVPNIEVNLIQSSDRRA